MIKKGMFIKIIIELLLFVSITFIFIACSNNIEGTNNTSSENSIVEEKEETKTVNLTKYNYGTYLEISFKQISQNSTLISNKYLVEYKNNTGKSYWGNYTGPTPPTGDNVIQAVYVNSNYSVLTTFALSVRTKSDDYSFSNAYFSLWYPSSQFQTMIIYVNQDGSGNDTFMINDATTYPSKIYSLKASELVTNFKGEVSFSIKK